MRLKVEQKVIGREDVLTLEATPYETRVQAENIYQLFQATAEKFPKNTALTFLQTGELDEEPIQINHQQLLEKINQAANMFHSLGITEEDTISFLLPSLPETHYTFWGGESVGIVNPINFLLNEAAITELLNTVECKVLVALGPYPALDIWEKVMAIRDKIPTLKAIIQVGGTPVNEEGIYQFNDLLRGFPSDQLTFDRNYSKDDIAAYFHTGGTTGTPKLVKQTHGNQIFSSWANVQMYHFTPQDVIANGMPLFHVAGSLIIGLAPLLAGAEVVILTPGGMRTPLIVKNQWKLAEKYGFTMLGGLPTSLVALKDVPLDGADLSQANYCLTGGAMLPQVTAEQFTERIGIPIGQVFGMTECSGILCIDPREGKTNSNSAGIRLPYTKIEIRTQHADGKVGEKLPLGEIGAIVYQGPNQTPGYLNPIHNQGAFTEDGFLICGDLGRIDEQGYLYVTGRGKDLIIRSGHNIDPLAVEGVAERHPDVLLCAAVARPDSYAGEVVALYVSVKAGSKVMVAELREYMEQNITERAALPKVIYIIDEIPTTAVGKIFKPQLRQDAAKHVYEEELQVLREQGIKVDVQVIDRPGSGMVAQAILDL
ncbi:MAG: acyl-CoA synthetase, partial [SAR324 cluster bacterium]